MNQIKLFLTEVDQHHPRPLINRQLRAYIMLNALFFDRLLVGDSQFNNNVNLRSLIWDKEPTPSTSKDTLIDFSLLLQEGYLLPTIRQDYHSLESLRQEHENRQIDNVPSKEFVEFAEQKIGDQRESYNEKFVSAIFLKRCLEAFSSPGNCGKGKLSKDKLKFIYDYISTQDPLQYKSLRKWALGEVNANRFTYRDYHLFDRIVSGAYRHNVPLALDINIDMPLLESRDPFPVTLNFGDKEKQSTIVINKQSDEWILPPALHLSNSFLSKIPAEALLYIKGSKSKGINPLPSYQKTVKHLERFRSGKNVNIDTLLDDLSYYLKETEVIVTEHLGRKPRISYFDRKQKAVAKGKVNLIIEGIVCAIGLIPVVGDIVGFISAGYGGYREIRQAARQEDYLDGVINGKSSLAESLLIDVSGRKRGQDTEVESNN